MISNVDVMTEVSEGKYINRKNIYPLREVNACNVVLKTEHITQP